VKTWSPQHATLARLPSPLLARAKDRSALKHHGVSGAKLERLTMPDGTRLVMKEISPGWDWMMTATHDTGRAAELWVTGAMDRCPPITDPAIVRIEQTSGGWRIYMRDVSDHFLRHGAVVERRDAQRLLNALAALHAAFWDSTPEGLCTLEDVVSVVAPRIVGSLLPPDHEFRLFAERGWDAFFAIAPRDVADAVAALLDDPDPLADRLRSRGTTLLHGDAHYGNVAPFPDRFVVIDWSLAAAGPPAIDFVWFLDQSAGSIQATREELIDVFRVAEADRHDERILDLAYLSELVIGGWLYRAAAEQPDSEMGRARRAQLDWWVTAARRGLAAW
jgi:hypothetical protein